jgi:hypothetical protein
MTNHPNWRIDCLVWRIAPQEATEAPAAWARRQAQASQQVVLGGIIAGLR